MKKCVCFMSVLPCETVMKIVNEVFVARNFFPGSAQCYRRLVYILFFLGSICFKNIQTTHSVNNFEFT